MPLFELQHHFFLARYDVLPPPNEHGNNPQLAAVETVVPRTGTANGCTSALRTAVSVPSNKTGWVAVAGDLEASTSATGAGASAPQLLTRAEYLLMLTSDYCFTETNQSHSRRLEMSDAAAAEALALAGPAGATSAAGLAAARMVEAQNAWRRVSEADGGVDATVEVFEAEDPDRTRQRRLSHDQEGDELAEEAYRAELAAALLSCADTACIRDALVRSLPPSSPPSPPLSAFGAMTAARPWELVSTQDQILVQRWAAVEGLGQWFRIVLPRTALVAELYLLNVPPLSGQLDPEPPPEAGCTANECAPLEVKRGAVLVGFHRRLDLLEAAGRVNANGEADARGYASIGTVTHLAADTISVQQDPPEEACPFDLFVWVPESLLDDYDVGRKCDGVFGVDTGSSINDGRTGIVLWSDVCAPPPPSPPSSPPPPSPPSSPPPPPPSSPPAVVPPSNADGVLRELAFGDVSGWGGLGLILLAVLLLCCCCCCVAFCCWRPRRAEMLLKRLCCCRRRQQEASDRQTNVILGVGSAQRPTRPLPPMSWRSSFFLRGSSSDVKKSQI